MREEDWHALDDEQCLSSSAVDIFAMIAQSVGAIYESGPSWAPFPRCMPPSLF